LIVFAMPQKPITPEEKISEYRKAADEAERSAARATDPDVKAAYLSIRRTWIYLAEELERETALAGNEASAIEQSDEVFVPPPTKNDTHRSR
jgi:hypothetical protein